MQSATISAATAVMFGESVPHEGTLTLPWSALQKHPPGAHLGASASVRVLLLSSYVN